MANEVPWNYVKHMAQGEKYQRQGLHVDAATQFELASMTNVDAASRARALQGQAVSMRVIGRSNFAKNLFNKAARTLEPVEHTNRHLLGELLRNRAMALFELGEFENAFADIEESLWIFESSRLNEYHASLSFRGRMLAEYGYVDLGITDLIDGYQHLYGRHPYRLNALVAWMRWMTPLQRWQYLPLAVLLSTRELNTRRIGQVVSLAVGGRRFHDWLKEQHPQRQLPLE